MRASYPQLVNEVMLHPAIGYFLPTTEREIVHAYREAWLRDNESVVGDILLLFGIRDDLFDLRSE